MQFNNFPSLLVSLLLITAVFLSGCSVKFYYNQLDWLVPWYVDDYVTLNAEQEVIFDAHLGDYLRWHRTEQLPVYADFLDWTASASTDGLDDTELQAIQDQVSAYTATMFTRLAPPLVDVFYSFSQEQVDELFDNFRRENLEYRKEKIEISEQQHRQERAEDVVSLVERWTGDLNDQQLQYIEEWSQQYRRMSADFLASREIWQKELKTVLLRRDDHEYLQQALLDLFRQRYSMRTRQYQEKYQFNEQLLKLLYSKLDQSLSQSQRDRMITELTALADDFRYLATRQ